MCQYLASVRAGLFNQSDSTSQGHFRLPTTTLSAFHTTFRGACKLANTMPPHLHNQSSSQAEGASNQSQSQSQGNQHQGNVYTGTGPESDLTIMLSPDIHTQDIGWFARVRFDQQVKQLAKSAGFQEKIVQEVYRHVGNFKEAEDIVKAMRRAAVECAKAEIKSQAEADEDSD
ncbi:hypothetical protein M405DRAFT_846759 [Rhizopogon salebrosus TDB-379]|nr:hypothetical protein M405DRAFT_846759 [Rhizopogon salebrosus TDB-379]